MYGNIPQSITPKNRCYIRKSRNNHRRKCIKILCLSETRYQKNSTLKRGTEEYGIRAKVKVAKNKVAPPFRIAEFDILFGKGISTTGCLLDLAEETNIIIRRGAWYSYEGENIGQGRDNTIIWLDQNLEIRNKVESMVKDKLTEGTEVSSNSMKALNSNPANTIAVNDIKTVA